MSVGVRFLAWLFTIPSPSFYPAVQFFNFLWNYTENLLFKVTLNIHHSNSLFTDPRICPHLSVRNSTLSYPLGRTISIDWWPKGSQSVDTHSSNTLSLNQLWSYSLSSLSSSSVSVVHPDIRSKPISPFVLISLSLSTPVFIGASHCAVSFYQPLSCQCHQLRCSASPLISMP